ncbi:MAG: hypothetical protein HYY16_10565 [Planctomycetes bacterium]|nr:hypothetical protein [Planctomycetota bacterium]
MFTAKDHISQALTALAERLEFAKAPAIELAVCGGAALHVMNLMTRGVTKDVDAFAIVRRDTDGLRLLKSDPLPAYVLREAAIVAQDFNLPADWLNAGPTSILDFGVPDGLTLRLHPIVYGPALTVHFLDRADQVYFKLYAAVDQDPNSRHIADLIALQPTAGELESAARWTMTHDTSEGFNRDYSPPRRD